MTAAEEPELIRAALEDYRTAKIREPLRATLAFLEKLTLTPEAVTKADADLVVAAGVSREALRNAIVVCTMFCTIDRIADAFGFEPNDAKTLEQVGRRLLKRGYSGAVI